jgi:hypothetical protein
MQCRVRREISSQSTAQILFFTGVRYQRMIDYPLVEAMGTGTPSEGGMTGKRKRKRG